MFPLVCFVVSIFSFFGFFYVSLVFCVFCFFIFVRLCLLWRVFYFRSVGVVASGIPRSSTPQMSRFESWIFIRDSAHTTEVTGCSGVWMPTFFPCDFHSGLSLLLSTEFGATLHRTGAGSCRNDLPVRGRMARGHETVATQCSLSCSKEMQEIPALHAALNERAASRNAPSPPCWDGKASFRGLPRG